jgi:hypothetical protein
MSLIIASPQGIIPTDELVENAIERNAHGWGLMYPQESGIVGVHKGFKLNTLLEHLKTLEGTPFVLHFRKSWNEKDVTPANNEPYKIADGMWMAYDGFIRDIEEIAKDRPRIYNFALNVAEMIGFGPEWFKGKNLVDYLGRWVDEQAVAAIMCNGSNEILLVHENMWGRYDGMLLSDLESTPEYIEAKAKIAAQAKTEPPKVEAPKTAIQQIAPSQTQKVDDGLYPKCGPPTWAEGEIVYFDNPTECEWQCGVTDTSFTVHGGLLLCKDCLFMAKGFELTHPDETESHLLGF